MAYHLREIDGFTEQKDSFGSFGSSLYISGELFLAFFVHQMLGLVLVTYNVQERHTRA